MSVIDKTDKLKNIVVDSDKLVLNYENASSDTYLFSKVSQVRIDLSPTIKVLSENFEVTGTDDGGSGGSSDSGGGSDSGSGSGTSGKHNLGKVNFNIKLVNSTNKTIYIAERVKFAVGKVVNGAGILGLLYVLGRAFRSYASVKIDPYSYILFDHSSLIFDPDDGGMKDTTNTRPDGGWTELMQPASYVNGGQINTDELNIYTYCNNNGNKLWTNNKVKGTLVNHTDLIFNAGTPENIELYEIFLTENPNVPYDYWTTP